MKIVIDGPHSPSAGQRIGAIVRKTLGEGRAADSVRVFVSRPRPGRWSVFITGLEEHPLPLVESIQDALERDE